MEYLSLLLLFCITTGRFVEANSNKQYSPIILIPTAEGIILEMKLNKLRTEHNCSLVSNWENVWITEEFITDDPYCFVENLRLWYDNTTRKTSNTPGVEVRTIDFGNTTSVEILGEGEYMYGLVENLVNNLSYTRGISVRAAPYDSRKAPNELGTYFDAFKDLVERTYSMNQNRTVVLLGHGTAAPLTYYFLNLQSTAWKTKYIKSFLSVNGPYGGFASSLRLLISGLMENQLFKNTVRDLFRSLPFSAWLMPHNLYWSGDEVLIQGPERNYTVNDYRDLFDDIGFPIGFQMREDTKDLNFMHNRRHPKVDVHCLRGIHIETPSAFHYPTWDAMPEVYKGNGDGQVNAQSLQGCGNWRSDPEDKTNYTWFNEVESWDILQSQEFFSYLTSVVEIK